MAHAVGFFDHAPGGPDPLPLGPFRFAPKAVLFWTTGFAGFHGTGSMSFSFGFATVDYANCSCIGSDTIVGHLDCGSVFSDPTQFAPIFAGASGTPEAYNRETSTFQNCHVDIGPDDYGDQWRTYYLALGGDTLQVAAGELFNSGTVSGLAFEPQLIIGHGARTAGADTGLMAMGFCDHNLNQGTAIMELVYFAEEVAAAGTGATSFYTVDAINGDGFDYTMNLPFGAAYLALADPGGAFFVGERLWESATITDPGFEPQIVIACSAVSNEDDNAGIYQTASITGGAAAVASGINPAATCAITGASKNVKGIPGDIYSGWGDSTLWNDSREDALLMSTLNDETRTGRAAVSSFNADGFTLDADTPGGTASPIEYAALRLSDYTVGACRRGALPILGVG